ncbi:PAS domain-containing protein [Sulfitobacter sp. HNIBRBA2951]|uniref:PAS domain-containing protein n=1 Tax=Sulfitobacter aquimarinus TaxID=3158557 RepID=UPI0032E04B90
MSDFQPHSGYAPISLVEAYWDALREGREMPKRADIDPRGIESALEYAFILERVAPGVARLRIAGTHLHDLMGMEARGMPLTSFFEHETRTRVAGLLEEVFQTPATAEINMFSTASLGQPALEARMILLPLKSDLGDVSRILGCFVAVGDIGTIPRRFDLRSVEMNRIGDGVAPAPADDTSKPAPTGFAEPQSGFEGPAGPSENVKYPPYLRLVKSDD